MANAIQSALARGLSVLASPLGNGETFRLRGVTATFDGSLTSQIVNDGIGGRIIETILVAPRSAFASLPTEGAVFDSVTSSLSYRFVEIRPGAGGFINIVVRSA
jgi:hypothetical protein